MKQILSRRADHGVETPAPTAGTGSVVYPAGLIGLTVVGLLIRLRYLHQPMRYDEAFSYLFFVQVPLLTTISDYSAPNQHILNSLLMRASAGLFGPEPWALRLPAFIFGVAIIPATFLALRRVVGRPAAFLASSFVTVSAPLIVYSTNARGYSLIVLLFLAMVGVSAAMREEESRHGWAWLIACSAVGLYAVPIMLYAIGGIFLWHGVTAWAAARRHGDSGPMRRLALSALAVILLTVVLYFPVLAGTGLGSLVANEWVEARTLPVFLSELPPALRALWQSWHEGMPAPVVIALLVGVAAYAWMPAARRGSLQLVLCVLLWCLALLLVTLRPPFARVWLFVLPLYFAIAAAGITAWLARLPPRWPGIGVAIAALTVSIWCGFTVARSSVIIMSEGPVFPDADRVVAYLAGEVAPGDGVYARTPADAPIWYYTWRRGLSDTMLRLKYNSRQRVLIVVNEASGQSIDHILALTRLGSGQFSTPGLLQTFEHARIYEVRPLLHGRR